MICLKNLRQNSCLRLSSVGITGLRNLAQSCIVPLKYTVMRESFLNRQMALYVLSLIWRKGYYGAYRTPSILRLFLFFFRR